MRPTERQSRTWRGVQTFVCLMIWRKRESWLKSHTEDFRVFDGQVAQQEEQVEAAVTEEQQQLEAQVILRTLGSSRIVFVCL